MVYLFVFIVLFRFFFFVFFFFFCCTTAFYCRYLFCFGSHTLAAGPEDLAGTFGDGPGQGPLDADGENVADHLVVSPAQLLSLGVFVQASECGGEVSELGEGACPGPLPGTGGHVQAAMNLREGGFSRDGRAVTVVLELALHAHLDFSVSDVAANVDSVWEQPVVRRAVSRALDGAETGNGRWLELHAHDVRVVPDVEAEATRCQGVDLLGGKLFLQYLVHVRIKILGGLLLAEPC
uniref:Putative secreted protein n=1 Tax=Rhipicephalus microplus TaxID=6941 RepID=A0A6G5A167_RHIMP